MKKSFRTLAFFAFLVPFSGIGQILKTDRVSVRTDTSSAIIGSISASFDFQDRSTSDADQNISTTFDLNSDLAILTGNMAFVLINQLNYVSVSNAKALNTGYTHLRLILNRKSNLSPEIFTQLQYDETRTMSARFIQGGGLKWTPVDTDRTDIHFGTGIMYEYERWSPPDMNETLKRLWKSSTYLGVNTQIGKNLQFHIINYYQVGKDGSLWRSRLSGDVWAEFQINSRFSFTSKFSYQYENKPVIDIRKNIILFSNGLTFGF